MSTKLLRENKRLWRTRRNTFFVMFVIFFLFFSNYQVEGYTSSPDILFNREFEKTILDPGEIVNVTVSLKNFETDETKGFYYTDNIPSDFVVDTVSVAVNGSLITNYSYEQGNNDEVYSGTAPHRWIIETPPDLNENNPISANGGTVEIVYTISCLTSGTYNFPNYEWVGILEKMIYEPVFGHDDLNTDVQVIETDTTPVIEADTTQDDDDDDGGGGGGCFITSATDR